MTTEKNIVTGMSLVCVEESEISTKFEKVVKIRWIERTILIKKSFLNSASIFGSEASYYLQKILSSYPDFERYILDDKSC